jgi:hypothetical protein
VSGTWYLKAIHPVGIKRERVKEAIEMRKVTRSLKLFAAEHVTQQNIRVALVLVTLATLIISAGAPGCFGDGNG